MSYKDGVTLLFSVKFSDYGATSFIETLVYALSAVAYFSV